VNLEKGFNSGYTGGRSNGDSMKIQYLCAAMLLALTAVAAQSQDAPAAKPPYEWKAEGDTAETFKATMVVNQKVDQSTPRGVVAAYNGFTDSRDATRKADVVIRSAWQKALEKSLSAHEEKLLAKEAREALAKARAEDAKRDPSADRSSPATEVTAETKIDDNSVHVETLQKSITRAPDKTGELHESVWENKYRYTCAKGEDGKWRIAKIERHQRDWESSEEKFVWKEDIGMLSFVYYSAMQKAPAEPAELKQDTAENAALSLYNALIAREKFLSGRLEKVALPLFKDAVEPLFTKEFIDSAKAEAEVESKRPEGDAPKGVEIDTVTDGENGQKIVKFKPAAEWYPPAQATLKQVEGKWQVVEAGKWENNGGIDTGPKYQAVPNIYNLPRAR